MAFSPAFMTTRHIFFSLIMGDGSKYGVLAVLRLTMKLGTNNAAVLASRRVLFSIPQITGMHKGGWLGFPPTSSAAAATHLLYISTGDGGPPNDPMGGVPGATINAGDAQVLTSLHGKLLRVLVSNDESRPAYDIPKDNPFAVAATASKRAEIYAYGFRNPWRCAFDRSDLSGKVWCGDVGQEAIEEVILVSPGVNYGWRGWEGSRCNLQTADPTECKRTPNTVGVWEICHENLIFSAAEKDVATRICKGKKLIGGSLTGGFIYRGKKYANIFNGDYIFADYQNRYLAGLKKLASGQWQEYVILDSSDFPQGQNFPQIASFAEDRDGELYMIAWEQNTHQNRVYKLPCGRMCNTGYVVPALSVPGKIEAEAFIAGDEGVAYHNVPKGEPTTTSNKLRTSAVTVQDLDNKAPDGRYIVGWTGPGEWMRYQVTVATAGRYVPKYRVARGQTPALPCGFSLLVDASRTARADTLCPSATAKVGAWSGPLSTTGPNGAVSWTTYIDVAGAPLTLAAGAHTLTLCIDRGDANIDYFTLAAAPAVRGAKKQVKKTRELDVAPDGSVSEAFEAFEEELEEYGKVEVVFEDGEVEEAVFEDVSTEDTDSDIAH